MGTVITRNTIFYSYLFQLFNGLSNKIYDKLHYNYSYQFTINDGY